MSETLTVYVSIGNSDDKLSQSRWSRYIADIDYAIWQHSETMHGNWRSIPDDPWQNACWCVKIQPHKAEYMKCVLSDIATRYEQESIAWAVAETEFITVVERKDK